MSAKVLLLGAGELGKEITLACQELGHTVVAADCYKNAPAMQVSQDWEVVNLQDGAALERIVKKHNPDVIIPEMEAVHQDCLRAFEQRGFQVVPSAKACQTTTNRKACRHLAAKVLKLRTPNYLYASNLDELIFCVKRLGLPCIVKSLSSSSGKGQSLIRESTDIEVAWQAATQENSQSNIVLVEEYIPFESEVTLLAVTQKAGPTIFCPPIGHQQLRGDYQESWQPAHIRPEQLEEAKAMAQKITWALGGAGVWGVEFFITPDKVYFNEVSPRPHDTALVTLAGTQEYNQFQLHARAIFGLAIPEITLQRAGASAVILTEASGTTPEYSGLEKVKDLPYSEVNIFGKPSTRPYRRMGVALAHGDASGDIDKIKQRAKEIAQAVVVK